jgi:dCTP deaminase
MTEQNERGEDLVKLMRAVRQINHLIESGYLPGSLADDLQRLIKLVEENVKLKKSVGRQGDEANMSVIVDTQIRKLCVEHGLIMPFNERVVVRGKSFGLSTAGYDIRIAQTIRLAPGDYVLASSVEHFNMPDNLLGIVHDKSTWVRQGITVQNTVIEPGWRGWLTLEIANQSRDDMVIDEGDPIAQIIFHELSGSPERLYTGKYQDQPNRPVEAIQENPAAEAP